MLHNVIRETLELSRLSRREHANTPRLFVAESVLGKEETEKEKKARRDALRGACRDAPETKKSRRRGEEKTT